METCHDACRRVVASEDAAARCFETKDMTGFRHWMAQARTHAAEARRLRMMSDRLYRLAQEEAQ